MFNVQFSMFNVQCSMFNVQFSMFNVHGAKVRRFSHSHNRTKVAFRIPNVWYIRRSLPLAYYIINVRVKAKKKLTAETKNKCEIILHFAHFSVSLSEENKPLGI